MVPETARPGWWRPSETRTQKWQSCESGGSGRSRRRGRGEVVGRRSCRRGPPTTGGRWLGTEVCVRHGGVEMRRRRRRRRRRAGPRGRDLERWGDREAGSGGRRRRGFAATEKGGTEGRGWSCAERRRGRFAAAWNSLPSTPVRWLLDSTNWTRARGARGRRGRPSRASPSPVNPGAGGGGACRPHRARAPARAWGSRDGGPRAGKRATGARFRRGRARAGQQSGEPPAKAPRGRWSRGTGTRAPPSRAAGAGKLQRCC